MARNPDTNPGRRSQRSFWSSRSSESSSGFIGILVGEFYAASEGLGFAISRFGDTYRLPEMFAGIVVLAVVAVGLTSGVRRIEASVAPWRAGRR